MRELVSFEHKVINGSQYTDVIWKNSSSRYWYHLTEAEILHQAEIIDRKLLTKRD